MTSVAWVLGIDPGKYKTGVAVGQTLTATAQPLTIIHTPIAQLEGQDFEQCVQHWRPKSMVMGMPELADGRDHPLKGYITELKRKLESYFSLPVYLHSEYLSSHEAANRAGQRRHIDDVAAAVILESWLSCQ